MTGDKRNAGTVATRRSAKKGKVETEVNSPTDSPDAETGKEEIVNEEKVASVTPEKKAKPADEDQKKKACKYYVINKNTMVFKKLHCSMRLLTQWAGLPCIWLVFINTEKPSSFCYAQAPMLHRAWTNKDNLPSSYLPVVVVVLD